MRYLVIILSLLFLLVACKQSRIEPVDHMKQVDEDEVKAHIAELAMRKNGDDPDSEFRYNEACRALIALGSAVEPHIIFELKNSDDWGIKLGAIEVAVAVGSKKSVEPLIDCLSDANPLVAQAAMYAIRVFCEHRIVPDVDSPGAPVPPIPRRKEQDPMEKDYELWVEWHKDNHKRLHRAWSEWWNAHKAEVKVE